jgi:DNA-binding NtrC family response regulator
VQALERLDVPYELAEALELAARIVPFEKQLTHHERARRIRQKLGIESSPPPEVEVPGRGIVAVDRASRLLIKTAKKLASLRKPILVHGETGVGKTLYAKLIHDSGPCAQGELIVFDCASWSERRMESGKTPDPDDLVETGKQGTVILANIHGASSTLQRLLVGVLDRTSDARHGSSRLHVISTTNEDLESLARQGRFSKDLYYRLAGFVLHVPPLRERKHDLEKLAETFAEQELQPEFLEILLGHTWPGNVIELRNAIDSAAILAGDEPIAPRHLPECLRMEPGKAQTLPGRIAALERREIRVALARTGNNKRAAARELGVSRKGLIDRLKRLNMWEEYGKTD